MNHHNARAVIASRFAVTPGWRFRRPGSLDLSFDAKFDNLFDARGTDGMFYPRPPPVLTVCVRDLGMSFTDEVVSSPSPHKFNASYI